MALQSVLALSGLNQVFTEIVYFRGNRPLGVDWLSYKYQILYPSECYGKLLC